MACKGEVKSLDDHWIWDNGDINVVISGINEVFLRKGVSRRHLCARCDLPMDIENPAKTRTNELVSRTVFWDL